MFNEYNNTNGIAYFNDSPVPATGNTYTIEYASPVEITLSPSSGYVGYLYQLNTEIETHYSVSSLIYDLRNLNVYFYTLPPSDVTITFAIYEEPKATVYFRDYTLVDQPVSPAGQTFTIPYDTEIYIYVDVEPGFTANLLMGQITLPLPYEDSNLVYNMIVEVIFT